MYSMMTAYNLFSKGKRKERFEIILEPLQAMIQISFLGFYPIGSKLNIHNNIIEKLNSFIKLNRIPNILFYGPSGSGKKTIVDNFINKIYNNDKYIINKYTLFINCSYEKGIKFIRDDVKYFAKLNINIENGKFFKTIILLNADKLTIDAQSALRRCIELFNDKTRFFFIVEENFKILKPILSRFCHIYIGLPKINNEYINLHKYNLNKYNNDHEKEKKFKSIVDNSKTTNIIKLLELSENLYNKGYSCLDLINMIENDENIETNKKYKILCYFDKIKSEFRNEKLLLFINLYFLKFRFTIDLENIIFI